jgi:mRNA-degrading endonuclease RelE of RelBE toxin-antitoxin system
VNQYSVYVTPAALCEVKDLPGHIRQRVKRAIDDLTADPHPPGSKTLDLSSFEVDPVIECEVCRLRIEKWRVLYTPFIRGWLHRCAAPSQDADDLVQEVLVVLTRKLPEFRHAQRPGSFRRWLLGITVNCLRKHRRAEGSRPKAVGNSAFREALERTFRESAGHFPRIAYPASSRGLVSGRGQPWSASSPVAWRADSAELMVSSNSSSGADSRWTTPWLQFTV